MPYDIAAGIRGCGFIVRVRPLLDLFPSRPRLHSGGMVHVLGIKKKIQDRETSPAIANAQVRKV